VDWRLLSAEYSLLRKPCEVMPNNEASEIGQGPDRCAADSHSEVVDILELCRIKINDGTWCADSQID
jgi:hypothetical protein